MVGLTTRYNLPLVWFIKSRTTMLIHTMKACIVRDLKSAWCTCGRCLVYMHFIRFTFCGFTRNQVNTGSDHRLAMSNTKLSVEVERKTLITKRPQRVVATQIRSKKFEFQLYLRNQFETLQQLMTSTPWPCVDCFAYFPSYLFLLVSDVFHLTINIYCVFIVNHFLSQCLQQVCNLL